MMMRAARAVAAVATAFSLAHAAEYKARDEVLVIANTVRASIHHT